MTPYAVAGYLNGVLPLLLAFALTAPAPAPGDAWRIIRAAQRAVETATEFRFEREWNAIAARDANRRVLLARAGLAHFRYQYERADSLYQQIIRQEPEVSEYAAAAYAGMGMWRSIGSDVVRAESLFVQARASALAAGEPHIAV